MKTGLMRVAKSAASPQVDMGITAFLFTATAAGDTVQVNEGQDPTSGRILFKWYAPGAGTYPIPFNHPLTSENGVYLTLSANIIEASVIYLPKFDYETWLYGQRGRRGIPQDQS